MPTDTMPAASAKELFVLGRVSSRPTHGHEIMRTLAESQASLWVELSEKHVYYILRKLERDGLVTVVEQRDGGRARKVFSATAAGRAAFARMMAAESLVESVPFSEFDVVAGMLGYTDALTDAEKTAILMRRRDYLRDLVTRAQTASAETLAAEQGGLPGLVLDKVARVALAELGWLDDVLAEIDRRGWAAMRPTFTAHAPAAPAAVSAAPPSTPVPEGDRS
jgi:DNA-binding PadR family transcriptional regulator